MNTLNQTGLHLLTGFLQSVERFPSRPALEVAGECLTYESLGNSAGAIADTIRDVGQSPGGLVALLANRSISAYAGVLGILSTGNGYVPLHPKLPVERLLSILEQSGCRVLVVGKECLETLQAIIRKIGWPVTVLCPDLPYVDVLPRFLPEHRYITANMMAQSSRLLSPPNADTDPVAYLLFTSGSTGKPKGVPVRHKNVATYMHYISDRYQVTEQDRFSQMFELTFDLSVHDMFVCWERGACLCVVPESSVMAPAKFIRDHGLTMWFSVPSVVGVLSRLGILRPGSFPTLRGSLFCGEPLPVNYVDAWQRAAPNSFVENLYGPTETTIAITHYRWDSERSPAACINGIVPIGWGFDGQRVCVIDPEFKTVTAGERGELCLSGSQVTQGYWNNPEKTAEQFIRIPAFGEQRWYRTGDLVMQDEQGCLHYLGRLDHQVKIRGHRVELQEVDYALSQASGTGQVAAVAWPVRDGIAEGIVAFIGGCTDLDSHQVIGSCRGLLPDYMVPKHIYVLDSLPLNIHGKTDRLKLRHMLEEKAHEDLTGGRTGSTDQGLDQAKSGTGSYGPG